MLVKISTNKTVSEAAAALQAAVQANHFGVMQVHNLKETMAKKGVEFEPYSFYLSAWEEDKYTIGQATVEVDKQGRILQERLAARKAGETRNLCLREELDLVEQRR